MFGFHLYRAGKHDQLVNKNIVAVFYAREVECNIATMAMGYDSHMGCMVVPFFIGCNQFSQLPIQQFGCFVAFSEAQLS